MTQAHDKPIALVGLMGAGKSAVARALGERLGTSVADLDAMIVDPHRRAALRERCRVVWLEVTPAEAARRVLAQSANASELRPLLAGGPAQERLAELLAARASMYAEVAHLRVPTDGRTPEQVADDVAKAVAAGE
jgi:shikimate kinase